MAGEQRLTIRGEFGEVQRRMYVRPGVWCNWELDLDVAPAPDKAGSRHKRSKDPVESAPLVLPSECGERPMKNQPPYRQPYGRPDKR